MVLLPKIIEAARLAKDHDMDYLWVDWLCIEASSSASMEEAMNGAFRLLKMASLCIVYLDDTEKEENAGILDDSSHPTYLHRKLGNCRYWSRAWSLQELIIPSTVKFYDSQWNYCGEKHNKDLYNFISQVTGISKRVLLNSDALWETSLAVRLSWAANRACRREEDIAYSLVAIIGVTMQIRYGEGKKRAFIRLQEEILQNTHDTSILAWRCHDSNTNVRGLLAESPMEFSHFSDTEIQTSAPWTFDGAISFNSRGIKIRSRVQEYSSINVIYIGRNASETPIGIYLAEWKGSLVRICPGMDTVMTNPGHRKMFYAWRYLDPPLKAKLNSLFAPLQMAIKTKVKEPQDLDKDFGLILRPGEKQLFSSATGLKRDSVGCIKCKRDTESIISNPQTTICTTDNVIVEENSESFNKDNADLEWDSDSEYDFVEDVDYDDALFDVDAEAETGRETTKCLF